MLARVVVAGTVLILMLTKVAEKSCKINIRRLLHRDFVKMVLYLTKCTIIITVEVFKQFTCITIS